MGRKRTIFYLKFFALLTCSFFRHSRLGENSMVKGLPEDTMRKIFAYSQGMFLY